MTSDYIILTKQGLAELEQTLERREQNYFRNRKISQPSHIEAWQAKHQNPYLRDIVEPITRDSEIENFNDELPLTLVTPSLKQYLTDLRNIQIKAIQTERAEKAEAERQQRMEFKAAQEAEEAAQKAAEDSQAAATEQ